MCSCLLRAMTWTRRLVAARNGGESSAGTATAEPRRASQGWRHPTEGVSRAIAGRFRITLARLAGANGWNPLPATPSRRGEGALHSMVNHPAVAVSDCPSACLAEERTGRRRLIARVHHSREPHRVGERVF